MASVNELVFVFSDQKQSWGRLLGEAATLSWEDWENDSAAFGKVAKFPEALSKKIILLSTEFGLDFEQALRNAIAMAPAKELPLARLVVVLLTRDGLLSESGPWLASLPNPSTLEDFISARLCGKFEPQPEAFVCLLRGAHGVSAQTRAAKNFLRSISPISGSARRLLARLVQFGLPSAIDAELLFQAISILARDEPLEPDVESPALAELPQAWRRLILANPQLSRLFLAPATIARIHSDPLAFPDTVEKVQLATLQAALSKELSGGQLSGQMVASLLQSRTVCEAIERDFQWSVLNDVSKCIQLDKAKGIMPSFNEFRYRTESGRFFSNLATVALSGQPEIFIPSRQADVAVVRQLLRQADRDVLRFAVLHSSGNAQFFLIQNILADEPDADLAKFVIDAFLDGPLAEGVHPRTLNAALPYASDEQREKVFGFSFAHADICAALLSWNSAYVEWFTGRLSRPDMPQYVSSQDLFKVYNALGEAGARIIEVLLSLGGSRATSKADLVQSTLQHAPGLAGLVFRGRHVRLSAFVPVIQSQSFRQFSPVDQATILGLSARRGKSALLLAFDTDSLTRDFLDWLAQMPLLAASVARHAPELLDPSALPLPELLAGVTRRPSRAAKLLQGIERQRLVEALPEALSLLPNQPRISAALELAVRSDVSALPLFMRLAKRLAPPYEKSDFGHRFDDLYTVYEVPKRSGGVRTISAPAGHLKAAQRALLPLLYAEGFSDQATGFVPGRSTRDNAAHHVGQDIVVNADVKAFFPSTGYKRVHALARKLCDGQLSPLGARLLSEIWCHGGHLATGAPTSPAVSNLLLRDMDARLDRISGRLGIKYSRYADDLTFSGGDPAVWMLKPARTFLARLGFELDPKKTNIFRKGRRQIVTGAVVNDKVNLARTLRKALRAAVDHRVRGKQPFLQGKPLNDAMLNGHLSYLKMLSPEGAAPLFQRLKGAAGWPY